MAAKFKGDPEAMRRESSAWLAKMLRVNLDSWSELERSTFSDFAIVLALVPDLERWTNIERHAVAEIIRAKVDASETDYLRLLQQHRTLKRALLQLGSVAASRSAIADPKTGPWTDGAFAG